MQPVRDRLSGQLHHPVGRGAARRRAAEGQAGEDLRHRLRALLSVRSLCGSLPDGADHGDLHVARLRAGPLCARPVRHRGRAALHRPRRDGVQEVSASLALFAALDAVVVCGAIGVVTRKNPVHAAIFLVLTIFGIAGIYIMLEAEFLAAVQVLVYAGGILVLFLFVIMLVDLEERGRLPRGPIGLRASHLVVALALAGALLLILGGVWASLPHTAPGASDALRAAGG